MKPFRCRWLPVLFSAWVAFVLLVRFSVVVRGYEYPWNHSREWWELPWLIATGRILVQPLCLFVERVLSLVDFQLACANFWHPVYLIGFFVLWSGYSGAFWLMWTWIVHEINRWRMNRP